MRRFLGIPAIQMSTTGLPFVQVGYGHARTELPTITVPSGENWVLSIFGIRFGGNSTGLVKPVKITPQER